jgi:predicted TIM-barrel fold metal-dependent hydrolase
MPFDTVGGFHYVKVALEAMDALDVSAADKAKILEHNARRLFRLGQT